MDVDRRRDDRDDRDRTGRDDRTRERFANKIFFFFDKQITIFSNKELCFSKRNLLLFDLLLFIFICYYYFLLAFFSERGKKIVTGIVTEIGIGIGIDTRINHVIKREIDIIHGHAQDHVIDETEGEDLDRGHAQETEIKTKILNQE